MTDITLLLDQLRTELQAPALVAIVTDSRSILAAGAVGVRHANRSESVTLTDLFQIGSNAKAMTATVCAMLVEQGILSWDLTPAAVFSELAKTMLPEYRIMTLEMLLSHTSGTMSKVMVQDRKNETGKAGESGGTGGVGI